MSNERREKIVTTFVYPPIPIRQFDWQATTDNYEPGAPMGNGATEQEAINDLIDRLEERYDERPQNDNGVLVFRGALIAFAISAPFWAFTGWLIVSRIFGS